MYEKKELGLLSPSGATSFCNHYNDWYNRYILGIEFKDTEYTLLGTAVHNMLETFFKNRPTKNESLVNYADRIFEESYNKEITLNENIKMHEKADFIAVNTKKIFHGYIQSYIKKVLPMLPKWGAMRVVGFTAPDMIEEHLQDDDIGIHGYLDAFYLKDKWHNKSERLENVVVDYKTSKSTPSTLHTEYFLQLGMYGLILRKQGKPVEWVAVDYVRNSERYLFRMTDAVYEKIEKFIKDLKKEMNEVVERYNNGEDMSGYIPKIKIEDAL